MRDGFDVRRVSLLHLFQVQPVQIFVVEEIAFIAPGLVVHLLPFDLRINVNLHLRNLQNARWGARSGRPRWRAERRQWLDRPIGGALPVKNLLSVGRHHERCDAIERLVEFAFFEIVFVNGLPELARRGGSDWLFEDVNVVRLSRSQANVAASWNRQCDDALINTFQINARRLIFLRGRLGSASGRRGVSLLLPFSRSPALPILLILGDFLFVAFRREWRRNVVAQDGSVNAARRAVGDA
ncbi:MAG: hypothetical protein JMDDDDMK_00165 [Acidobacteria bacterium]|nr:hypothetical protein [Acidobacteriota bacterium]